ncbi:MAG: hypothetical protein ACTFAK_16640 [Candidatus Electronema sp. VV]
MKRYSIVIIASLFFCAFGIAFFILSYQKTWSNLEVGVAGSVIASCLTAAFSMSWFYSCECCETWKFKKTFGEFFGGCKDNKKYTFVIDHYRSSDHQTTNMGSCNAYILTYLSPLFDKYIGSYPTVVLDDNLKDWEQTLVVLGSPSTNIVAKKAMKNNEYLKFTGTDDHAESIEIIIPGYDGPQLQTKDGHYGIVLKLANPYSKGHFLFFLAGLTNESTSAGGLLLRKHWEKIRKEIKESEFLVVYKVDLPGEDQTFKILYTYPEKLSVLKTATV